MAPWLPPEVLLRIVSYVHDISTLLSLRLVNRGWSEIANAELDHWACVSLNRHSMNEFEFKFKDKQLRQRITDVAVILPDRDYWHVSAAPNYLHPPLLMLKEADRYSVADLE